LERGGRGRRSSFPLLPLSLRHYGLRRGINDGIFSFFFFPFSFFPPFHISGLVDLANERIIVFPPQIGYARDKIALPFLPSPSPPPPFFFCNGSAPDIARGRIETTPKPVKAFFFFFSFLSFPPLPPLRTAASLGFRRAIEARKRIRTKDIPLGNAGTFFLFPLSPLLPPLSLLG